MNDRVYLNLNRCFSVIIYDKKEKRLNHDLVCMDIDKHNLKQIKSDLLEQNKIFVGFAKKSEILEFDIIHTLKEFVELTGDLTYLSYYVLNNLSKVRK